jgi:hypothetical protein
METGGCNPWAPAYSRNVEVVVYAEASQFGLFGAGAEADGAESELSNAELAAHFGGAAWLSHRLHSELRRRNRAAGVADGRARRRRFRARPCGGGIARVSPR